MEYQFRKHYTRDQARALLPRVRELITQLRDARRGMHQSDDRIAQISKEGADLGGNSVNNLVRSVAALKQALQELESREIQIKDMDRGLVDFPAIVAGKEVFLCWEEGEDDIEHWHDLESGFAGREALD